MDLQLQRVQTYKPDDIGRMRMESSKPALNLLVGLVQCKRFRSGIGTSGKPIHTLSELFPKIFGTPDRHIAAGVALVQQELNSLLARHPAKEHAAVEVIGPHNATLPYSSAGVGQSGNETSPPW